MTCGNIRRLLYMGKNERGRTWTFREFESRYRFEPDGVNAYFGVNRAAVDRWKRTGAALGPEHAALLEDLAAALLRSTAAEKWLNLGLWPYEAEQPYAFVLEHLELLDRLAAQLRGYQDRAHAAGKRLEVAVRYASEMNDPAKPSQPWGRRQFDDAEQQRLFRESFRAVRGVFHQQAGTIRFVFSPAMRRDNAGERYPLIERYWPGDGHVDLVGCTWYVGRESDLEGAAEGLRRYCRDWKSRGLPFALDEIGGIHEDADNDGMLRKMLAAADALRADGIAFEYATLFLESKWGRDASLRFLTG